MVKVAINGFGRIGRVAFRAAQERYADEVEIVAINTSDSMDIEGWVHLLKHDSIYGKFQGEIGLLRGSQTELGILKINSKKYPLLAYKEPAKIPWNKYGVEVVLEATGVFRKSKDCEGHLSSGAKKVIISAPPKDETPTYLVGVNADQYQGESIVSNASCTTNCIAPITRIVRENFRVVKGMMTTVHAYTADQQLVDGSHRDLRRARAGALNIIPTSTGAAKSLGCVIPEMKNSFDGLAIRVPVACGSLADFTFLLDQNVRGERMNRILEQAAAGAYRGIVEVSSEPLVSSDIIGSSASAIVDLCLTQVVGGNMVKIIAWYDNEYGYACRLIELASIIGK